MTTQTRLLRRVESGAVLPDRPLDDLPTDARRAVSRSRSASGRGLSAGPKTNSRPGWRGAPGRPARTDRPPTPPAARGRSRASRATDRRGFPFGLRVRDHTRVMPADTPRTAHAAVDYLNALYQPDDRLAIVAVGRHGPNPKVEQRLVTARAATRPAYQRFLRHLNATGHDIFVSMNPIRPSTRSREKADVLEVRRLQLDLDKNGPDSLKQILSDVNTGQLPAPAAVLRSSRLELPDRLAHGPESPGPPIPPRTRCGGSPASTAAIPRSPTWPA